MVQVSRRSIETDADEDEDEAPRRTKVIRRRDRVTGRHADVEETGDVDATDVSWEDDDDDIPPARSRSSRVRDEEDEDEAPRSRRRSRDEEDEDNDDEPRSRRRSRVRDEEDDDEDTHRPRRIKDDDDDESRSRQSKEGPPPGVRRGWAGAEAVRKSAGGNVARMTITKEPQLIKFLQPEPAYNLRQHWVEMPQQGNRPYTCIGVDCPICEVGDKGGFSSCFNVLLLSESEPPSVKLMQLGVKAYEALKTAAYDKATDKIRITRDFFAVSKSGKDQQSQTNFRPVKERDIEDDWAEVLEFFDLDELPELIEKGKKKLYSDDVVQVHTKRQLREVAQYLADED